MPGRAKFLALFLALGLTACGQRHPVAKVLFFGTSGTGAWVGKDALLTVPHVAVGDRCRVFVRSMSRWVWAWVTYRAPAWVLIRLEGGWVRKGDSGCPVIDTDGLLIGLVEAGRDE